MRKETIETLIDAQKTAYIGSVDGNGVPNIKAMLAPRKRDGLREFWFTTNTSSMRVMQYHVNSKACIYFCDNRFFRGIMLLGVMDVLEDSVSKEMIWREGDEMYYPKGVTDLDYCVLKFTAQKGRFYSNFNSKDFEV
ncbi:MAG: pyridoxamine 5'-phosphate oxidase family protein [Candidatus Bathyarchaeota archaeon]|nr:pyridoxamine 5'-phosphate oxidase family protein [Candidatus Termiticorpusculum sp.]